MAKYHAYGVVTGGKYLGEVEADNEAAAIICSGWRHKRKQQGQRLEMQLKNGYPNCLTLRGKIEGDHK